MKTKNKLIIAIASFALVLVAVAISIVAVLAAQQVTIKSQISINYQVDDVVADVAVYAKNVKTTDTLTASTNLGTAQTFNFGIEYTGEDKSLTGFNFNSLKKDECIVVKFVFNNNSANAFTATLTKPSIATNDNIAIYFSNDITKLLASTTTDPSVVSVAAGDTATNSYYAVIKIADNTKSVNTTVDFSWFLA